MDAGDALKIVEVIERTAEGYAQEEDHARVVVGYALGQLGRNMADALGVPPCSCRYGHDEGAPWANKDCPRRGFGV